MDEPVECAPGGDQLLLYKILHLLFFLRYEFFVHCALRVEKNYQHGLDSGPLEFVSAAEGMCHQPIQNSVVLFRGHKQNTRSHLP